MASSSKKVTASAAAGGASRFASIASVVGLVVLGSWSLTLLYGWTTFLPLVTPPLLVGLCLGLCCDDVVEATIVGISSGLVGSFVAYSSYAFQPVLDAMKAVPEWANKDIARVGLYEYMIKPMLAASAFVAAEFNGGGALMPFFLGVVITPLSCVGLVLLLRRVQSREAQPVIAAALAILLVSSAAFTAVVTAPIYRQQGTVDPAAGASASDIDINLATFYSMQRGQGFYPAYVAAHAADARQLYPVVGGKFVSVSATMLREPTMFYFWQLLAMGGPAGTITLWSVVLAMLTLLALGWGLWPALGRRAIFVIPVLLPFFILASSGFNVFQPEWWATLLLLGSVALLLRRMTLAAIALALVAMLFRETFALWLLVLAALLTVAAWRWSAPWRQALVAWCALAAGVAFFGVHVILAGAYISHPAIGSVFGYLAGNVGQSLDVKFFSPMFYIGFPYALPLAGFGYLGVGFDGVARLFALVLPLGMAGCWVAFADEALARYATVAYLALFGLFFLAVGATGQYWGQNVIPLALVGTVALLASLDKAVDSRTWKPTLILTVTGTEAAA